MTASGCTSNSGPQNSPVCKHPLAMPRQYVLAHTQEPQVASNKALHLTTGSTEPTAGISATTWVPPSCMTGKPPCSWGGGQLAKGMAKGWLMSTISHALTAGSWGQKAVVFSLRAGRARGADG